MPLTPAIWLNDFVVNLTTTGSQLHPRITQLANGNILVVWDSTDDSVDGQPGTDVIGQLFDPLGQRIGSEFNVNIDFSADNEGFPDIAALDDGGFLMVFQDNEGADGTSLRLEEHNADGSLRNSDTIQQDTATTQPNWSDPQVVVSSPTSALVIYVSDGDTTSGSGGTDTDIMGRLYDSTTNTLGAEISLLSGGVETAPDVAVLDNGNYVVVAEDSISGGRITMRIIDASGGNVLNFTVVDTTGIDDAMDSEPSVTALTGGRFVVAWSSVDATSTTYSGKWVLFDAAGNSINSSGFGSSFSGPVEPPTVIGLGDGGFLMFVSDGSSPSFYLNHYGSNGALLASDAIDNSFNRHNLDAQLLGDGRVAVSYTGQDGEVHMQILDARDEANTTGVYTPQDWQIGTVGNDTITSDGDVYFIAGHAGDDVINTLGPAATYYGGEGNDTVNVISSGDPGDNWHGDAGYDVIDFTNSFAEGGVFNLGTSTALWNHDGLTRGMDGFETLIGTMGNDSITGSSVTEQQLEGGQGDDTIIGQALTSDLHGGSGNDSLQIAGMSTQGSNLFGDDGNDTLQGGDQRDHLYGGNENDSLDGGAGSDELFGGLGDDTLIGGSSGSDTVSAGDGNDLVIVSFVGGTDSIDGGADTDTVSVGVGLIAATVIDLAAGTINSTAAFSASWTNFENYENLTTFSTLETVLGTEGANLIDFSTTVGAPIADGRGGADTLLGGAGTDSLTGGAGEDSLVGNAGNDSLFGGADNDQLNGGANDDSLEGGTGDDDLTGSDGFDTLAGGTGNDSLFGGAQDDILDAGDNDDLIDGGLGRDILFGGAGDDTFTQINELTGFDNIDGGTGIDKVTFSGTTGAMTVDLDFNNYGFGGVFFGLIAVEDVTTGSGDDVVWTSLDTTRIDAGAGNDRIVLSDLTVTALGGTGRDALDLHLIGGNVTINLGTSANLTGFEDLVLGLGDDSGTGTADANVILGSGGNDALSGLGGNDSLRGDAGNDTLDGGANNDTLTGGANNDTLIGGAGADSLDGGADIDTASYATSALGVTVRLWNGTGVGGDAQGDVLTGIENVIGSAVSDALVGADVVANLLSGGAGADFLSGLSGNDTLQGEIGNDQLYGGLGDDVLYGGDNDDLMDGGVGADNLFGGAGNDDLGVMTTATGFDDLNGGTGTDKASFAGTTAAMTINFIDQFYDVSGSAYDYVLMEEVTTGSGDDTILSSVTTTRIDAGAGNDRIVLADLTVTALGGIGRDGLDLASIAGNQTINLGTSVLFTGFEDLVLGTGNDTATGTTGANALSGGAGNDLLSGLDDNDSLKGDAGNDSLDGGAGVDTLNGGTGNDLLTGGAGADVLDGGADIDTASYAASALGVTVRLWNGTGTGGDAQGDTLTGIENVIGSGVGDSLLGANLAANLLSGGAGADYLAGLSGNDTLEGGIGADSLDGGADIDTASYANSAAGVTVNLSNGTGLGGDAQGDTLAGFENIIGSGQADVLIGADVVANLLTGGAGNDALSGLSGNDSLDGGTGNDTLAGGVGADRLDGGANTDTASYATSVLGVTVRLWNGTGTGGDAQGDTLLNIENVIGSGVSDVLIGSDVVGNLLSGGAGADYIAGLSGNDTLEGGIGADSLDGGAGIDTASYASSAAAVTVKLWNGTGLGGDAQGDTLAGFENLIGSGQADVLIGADVVANVLSGGAGSDYLAGVSGNDSLDGGTGNDTLEGGVGADRLDGGANIDTASYATSVLGVTVRLWNGTGIGGDAQGDTLIGIENVIGSGVSDGLVGADGVANLLSGGAGADYLGGLSGDDTLDGGSGNDILEGGTGSDVFVFGAGYNHDVIVNFENGIDRVDLIGGLTFANLTLTAIAGGVHAAITASPTHSIDLMGVTLGDINALDFI